MTVMRMLLLALLISQTSADSTNCSGDEKKKACSKYSRDEIARVSDANMRHLLKDLLKDYNPKLRPDYLGPPVAISIDATILTFTNLDAINMMYTIDMFFRQRWIDHRLKHKLNESITLIVGTSHPSNIIWTPDTVFINSVTSRLHHVTVSNHKLDIYPNGTVFWGTRITVSPSCSMDLKAYPMDVQLCGFEIVSYTYDARHLTYNWHWEPGIKIMRDETAQFKLVEQRTENKEFVFVAGNYTVLRGKFRFKRLMGFAILQIYIPSTAIVMVSWVSLWIKRTAIPARVSLCITTLLTISTIWSSVNSQLPRVNYIKAVDIYLMTSFCCVILALMEYTIVLNCGRIMELFRKKKKVKTDEEDILLHTFRQTPRMRTISDTDQSPSAAAGDDCVLPYLLTKLDGTKEMDSFRKIDKKEEAKKITKEIEDFNEAVAAKIEIFARVFFPLSYALFNMFYWITYLDREILPMDSDL